MRYLSSIILLIGAVAVFFVFTRPELDAIGVLRIEEANIAQSLGEMQELARVRDELLSQYNAINAADIERLGRIVPSSIDSGLLIAELERFSQEHNLILTNIGIADETAAATERRGAIKRPEDQAPFQKLPLSLQLSGSYGSFRDFLTRLETNTRIVDITSVQFSSGETDFFEFDVEASTYWIGNIK